MSTPPEFETMAYFTIDNIFPNLSDSQRESAATFIKLSLEAAFKAGREKGLDEAAEFIAPYSSQQAEEIIALKEKEPK